MSDRALELASRITDPVTACTWGTVLLAFGIIWFRKSKDRILHRLLACGIIVLSLAPIGAWSVVTLTGMYHLRVVVLGLDHQPVSDAEINILGATEKKKTDSGWEFDIPSQAKPADGEVSIFAKIPSSFLTGSATITLGRDYFPSIQIPLIKMPSVTIRGIILDDHTRTVPDADVTIPECGVSTKSDVHGMFTIDSCVAGGEMVKIRAEKGKLSGVITTTAGDTTEIVLRRF